MTYGKVQKDLKKLIVEIEIHIRKLEIGRAHV